MFIEFINTVRTLSLMLSINSMFNIRYLTFVISSHPCRIKLSCRSVKCSLSVFPCLLLFWRKKHISLQNFLYSFMGGKDVSGLFVPSFSHSKVFRCRLEMSEKLLTTKREEERESKQGPIKPFSLFTTPSRRVCQRLKCRVIVTTQGIFFLSIPESVMWDACCAKYIFDCSDDRRQRDHCCG